LPEEGLTIRGKVIDAYNDKNLSKIHLGITIPSIGVLNETFKITEAGTFQINGLRFMDSTRIYIQAFKEKGSKTKKYHNAKINLEYLPRPIISNIIYSNPHFNSAYIEKAKLLAQTSEAYFLDNEATLLEEIEVTARNVKQTEMEKRTLLYQEPSNRLILDTLGFETQDQSVFDLLRRIPGITITGTFPNQSVVVRGFSSLEQSNEALYILDGVPTDKWAIQFLQAHEVEFIDVLKGAQATIYGSRGSNGVILVYTRRDRVTAPQGDSPSSLLTYIHPGYHKAKEFFSPNYETEIEEHIIHDFRTTLYWNPELNFQDNSEELSFYTSDQSGSFTIRIEGVFATGQPFFEECLLSVK
jgi:TonB-dependent SusC/RagA subfamily outer membrane receptor